jgi:hypothetical protein
MMIAYAEVEKHLVHRKIKPKDWDQTKESFHKLLTFTVGVEPNLGTHSGDIQSYHQTRNNLYHTGLPLSVKAAHVNKYLDIAKSVLQVLFGTKLSQDDWDKKVALVSQTISGKAGKAIKAAVTVETVDNAVRVQGINANLAHHEVLCIVIDAFTTKMGTAPTMDQLEKSLQLSGTAYLSGINLSKRTYDARKKGLIQKDRLALTPDGRKLVAQKTVLA